MADRRNIKKNIKRLEEIKTWQLVVVLLLAAFISATFLRLNNVGMSERRNAVIAADKAGDEQTTANRLFELQQYSIHHMNASSGDIYLTGQYDRDSTEIINKAMAEQTPATPIAVQAYNNCRKIYSSWSQQAVQCVSDEVARLTPKGDDGTLRVKFPSPDLYRHSFISPVWSPDFAGFSLLATAVIALLVLLRILSYLILKILLKWHFRRA